MKYVIECEGTGKTILSYLREQGGELPLFCGGRGNCGKCKIKILKGNLPAAKEDKRVFSEEELEEGYRLACKAVTADSRIIIETLWNDEQSMQVEGLHVRNEQKAERVNAVIDIGTTTLAMALVSEHGEIVAVRSGINRQRSYGTDVMSRIEEALAGKQEIMTQIIREDIWEGIYAMLEESGLTSGQLGKAVLCANTVMEYLFLGYPVKGLAKYPFSLHEREKADIELKHVYQGEERSIRFVVIPGFDAFVGGDITAGIYALLSEQPKVKQSCLLFLDLGTNGEMALRSNGIWYTASAAGGPVFEGGNMLCGMASIPGAISHVWIEEEQMICETIKKERAIGICGTGYVEAIAALLEEGVIKGDGTMQEGYRTKGYALSLDRNGKPIVITQQDIREFQLAKAAIRAGIELLIKQADISIKDVDMIGVAGGFGTQLDIRKAIQIGLLPDLPLNKYLSLGNTAIKGCLYYSIEKEQIADAEIEKIRKHAVGLMLAEHAEFPKMFLQYMDFKV